MAAQELARTAAVDAHMLIEEARITLESRDEREASRLVGEYCGLPDEDFSLVCRRARQAAASLMGRGFKP